MEFEDEDSAREFITEKDNREAAFYALGAMESQEEFLSKVDDYTNRNLSKSRCYKPLEQEFLEKGLSIKVENENNIAQYALTAEAEKLHEDLFGEKFERLEEVPSIEDLAKIEDYAHSNDDYFGQFDGMIRNEVEKRSETKLMSLLTEDGYYPGDIEVNIEKGQ